MLQRYITAIACLLPQRYIIAYFSGSFGINHGIELHEDVVEYAREKVQEFIRHSRWFNKWELIICLVDVKQQMFLYFLLCVTLVLCAALNEYVQ